MYAHCLFPVMVSYVYMMYTCMYVYHLTQYAAVDSLGSSIAVAGLAGFALYSGIRKKWKLFGNEIQVRIIIHTCTCTCM